MSDYKYATRLSSNHRFEDVSLLFMLEVLSNLYYMKSYCVKQKKVTECVPGSDKYVKTKNNRTMLKCKCAECGATKAKFVKG